MMNLLTNTNGLVLLTLAALAVGLGFSTWRHAWRSRGARKAALARQSEIMMWAQMQHAALLAGQLQAGQLMPVASAPSAAPPARPATSHDEWVRTRMRLALEATRAVQRAGQDVQRWLPAMHEFTRVNVADLLRVMDAYETQRWGAGLRSANRADLCGVIAALGHAGTASREPAIRSDALLVA